MSEKGVVEVGMSEVIHHLQANGEMKKALNAVVAKKAAGGAAETVRIINDLAGKEISDAALEKVAGGGGLLAKPDLAKLALAGSKFDVQLKQGPGGLPGRYQADTSW